MATRREPAYLGEVRRALPLVLVSLVASLALAQDPQLITGGERARYGVHELRADSDALRVSIVSGGRFDVRSLETAPSCRGNVMLEPDVILRLQEPPPSLRLSVRAAGDTTLVVRTPDGQWRCDDDGGGATNPALTLEHPLEGQYDVWVGSYRPEQHLRGRLTVE